MAQATIEFAKLLPAELGGWKRSDTVESYDSKTLFKYINGGAELYRSYGFKSLIAMTYGQPDGAEIKVDIFDMGHPHDAFGVYSHGRESSSREVGQGSEYAAGLLTFFKHRYYVSLLGYPETPEKKKQIFELARRIAALIPREGALPPIVGRLPQKNLVPESVRYFNHHIWLNTHYFVSHENLLLIDRECAAVLAKYADKKKKYYLLLIQYPTATKAKAAQSSFQKKYLSGSAKGVKQIEDGRFTGVRRKGRQLTVMFNGASAQQVEAILTQMTGP